MSKGKFLKEHGGVEVDQEFRDVRTHLSYFLLQQENNYFAQDTSTQYDLLAQRYTLNHAAPVYFAGSNWSLPRGVREKLCQGHGASSSPR
jgi:hypothetical protein